MQSRILQLEKKTAIPYLLADLAPKYISLCLNSSEWALSVSTVAQHSPFTATGLHIVGLMQLGNWGHQWQCLVLL